MTTATQTNDTQPTTDQPTQPPAVRQPDRTALAVIDDSQFENLLDSKRFEHMWRVGKLFAASDLVPPHYQNKPENCFLATQASVRLGIDPLMFMQNTCIVHNKPGMEAKLVIALINSSGLFRDSLDYEVEGDDATKPDYRVRAWAVRKSTGKVIYGPWIDWKLVKAEGWDKKNGSKWLTMPAQMFHYRAAAFFSRLHCPERLMGMATADELDDISPGVRQVENRSPAGGHAALAAKLGGSDTDDTPTDPPVSDGEPDTADTTDANAENVTDGTPAHVNALVGLMVDTCDCTPEAARKKLDEHCKKVRKTPLAGLSDEDVADVRQLIAKGTLKV